MAEVERAPGVRKRRSQEGPNGHELEKHTSLGLNLSQDHIPWFGLCTGRPREYFESLQVCSLNRFHELWILLLCKGSFWIKDEVLEGLLTGG